MFTKERDDASRALQAAITRAEQSRRSASGANGQNNFPAEWRDAESKNQAAQNAKRATVDEMKAATPLYVTAANAYDNIARLNTARQAEQAKAAEQARQAEQARAAEEARKNMNNAKAQADRARQAAVDAKANLALPTEFNAADGVYRQAVTASSNANSVAAATNGFNQAAAQFTAAANAVGTKRREAEGAISRSKERRAQSVARATNIGRIMDGEIVEDTEGDNE
jgi:chemosensory pili system protein ChpA (sensor histidine kinase/response regulator)